MHWVIIPHLAVFNVMITLGELAWLCNSGLVLHELRTLAREPTSSPLLHVINRNQVTTLLPKQSLLSCLERNGAARVLPSVCLLSDVWFLQRREICVVPDVWLGPHVLQ